MKTHAHNRDNKIEKSTKKYEKISELSESTTPITKRRLKNTPLKKGRGGHTSTREYSAIRRKEPENRSIPIRFQDKTQAIPRKTQGNSKPPKYTTV